MPCGEIFNAKRIMNLTLQDMMMMVMQLFGINIDAYFVFSVHVWYVTYSLCYY